MYRLGRPSTHASLFYFQGPIGCVESGRDSYRQSELVVGMADCQTIKHRHLQIAEDVVEHLAQTIRNRRRWLVVLRMAVLAFTKDHSGDAIELSCQPQVSQHAIDAVRFFINVFEEQNLASRLDLVG